ncbi:MAG: cupin domain-containing protein [Proteobacteria bacterium]|nr:cupin domain-containing protein [Burkholderiales bacterium]
MKSFRRVVTGFNSEGKSCIKWDTQIEPLNVRPGFDNIPLWATKKLPAETATDDPNTWELGTSLAGGSVFRFGRYAPGNVPRWHATDSVDYAICLAGEMIMEMDEGSVHLKPGDVVIQLGTNHNWRNPGKEDCVMAYVLIATEGAKTTGWTEHNKAPGH